MTIESVLVAKDLSRDYQQGNLNLSVLKAVNLDIKRGEKLAIVGVSGSGKTTLLNLLGGLDDPSSGTVLVCDQHWGSLGASDRASWRNQHVGFVYQFHHLLPEFTAIENVAMPLLIRGDDTNAAKKKASELLEEIGLGHRLEHRPIELSGGERQRAAIARALVTEPNVVLADEPTGNLDESTAQSVFDMMMSLNRRIGTALVMVTHDTGLAAKMDKRYHLESGALSDS